MKRVIIMGMVVLLSFIWAGTLTAQETLKIGAPQPMTGPDAPFGAKFKKAYDLAVAEINAAGGVKGKKLEVIIEDHQAKNPLAATVAEKLINQAKVLILTGGRASGQAVEIASVAQRLKTPYLVDHPSADIVTVLLVEQNTQHALSVAHKGFVLELARVVLSGSGAELLADENVRKAYLGIS
jgi:hypothetical protein